MTVPATPDGRIRFPSAAVDFTNTVGVTGQAHDSYPKSGDPSRFDWLRLYLIGLLSNQASYVQPTEHREGTIWFNLNTLQLEVQQNGQFVSLAQAIQLDVDANGHAVTLAQWYASVLPTITSLGPVASFSGSCRSVPGIQTIPIPASLQTAAGINTRPLVYINGALVDPRNCNYQGAAGHPSSVLLSGGVSLNVGDRFTVVVTNLVPSLFYASDVTV